MEKLDGKTFDIVSDNIKKLEELFPEIVTEGNVDVDKLALLFDKARNEDTDGKKDGEERYEFTWKGKKEAIRMAQKQTTGTLRPYKDESVNFDETQNLYIEGDNLEVLRSLQSSYRGKIKMIYIDPPYNTGKDFVYKDNFNDNIQNYKKMMNESYKTNTDASGRFHTNWLNMMYPRLKLAKNLLTDDGVIFISIDENEITNLKKICDEVFGESNLVSNIIPIMNPRGSQSSKNIAVTHEYILAYSKKISLELYGLGLTEDQKKEYSKQDNDGYYRELGLRKRGADSRREDSPTMYYPIYYIEEGGVITTKKVDGFIEILPKLSDGSDGRWRWGKDKVEKDKHMLICRKVSRNGSYEYDVFQKDYLTNDKRQKPKSVWDEKKINNEFATELIKELFDGKKIFDYSKSIDLIKKIITISTKEDDIILDFFSGSSATAHAILDLNVEDGGNRKFIMIQLPEETDEKSEAYKAGYKTICEIGKERIRRAGKKILEENKNKEGIEDLDIGFKVFKLDTTNIKEWDDTVQDTEKIKQMAMDLENPIKEDRSPEDIVYEILLKYGIDLTMPIEEVEIMGYKVYSVGFGYLMICLEKDINLDLIESIADKKPNRVVLYDKGLENEIKVNAMKIFKEYGVEDIRTI